MSDTITNTSKDTKTPVRQSLVRRGIAWRRNRDFYLLLIVPAAYFIIFAYLPIWGNVLAFRRYIPGGILWGEEWVGFRYFRLFMSDPIFWNAFKNTMVLAFLSLLCGFPAAILFALLLNELRNRVMKRFVQTVSFLPYFFSMVVVVGMIKSILSPSTGFINSIIENLGGTAIFFVNEPGWYRTVFVASDVWQTLGFNAIIYISALSSIDPTLYEAAVIDGANRLQQTVHVTLPGLMPMIIITLILRIGQLLNVNFEKALLLYTPNNSEVSDIIHLLVYRQGLQFSNYSYATAVGMFNAVVGLLLILGANWIARRTSEVSFL